MSKRFWISVFITSLLLVAPTMAAESDIPEFNSICWQKAQCLDMRAQILAGKEYSKLTEALKKQVAEGFREDQGLCTGGQDEAAWGKCLPSTIARTEIAFGGKSTFTDIGDFLKTNYNYVMGLAAILAVIMIIVAGFQWVMSGGNSESITSAKNRISGALIGLFIAYSSFFILRTVNPALVALRLPQSWMVRPQALIPQFCAQATSTYTFSSAGLAADQRTAVSPGTNTKYDLKFSQVHDQVFDCGNRFFLKNGNLAGGGQTCFGNYCPAGSSCMLMASNDPKLKQFPLMKYNCKDGQLFVRYNVTALQEIGAQSFTGGWLGDLEAPEWLDDRAGDNFWPVCQDPTTKALSIGTKFDSLQLGTPTLIDGNPFKSYDIVYSGFDKHAYDCASPKDTVGFIYKVELKIHHNFFKDANLIIGKNGISGMWGTHLNIKNYIPIKDLLGGGVSFTVNLDNSQIDALVKNKGSEPQ